MRHNYSSVWRGLVMVGAVALGVVPGLLRAQVVGTDYTFVASNGTYTAISGTVVSTTADDDELYFASGAITTGTVGGTEAGTGYPIGFTFRYGEQNYTTFAIGANGYIKLGNAGNINMGLGYHDIWNGSYISTMPTPYSSLSSLFGLIMPLMRDFQFATGASCSYTTTGTAPNRVCVIQWAGIGTWSSTGPVGSFNVQVRLNEGSNNIEFVYGTTAAGGSLRQFLVGLRGGSENDHYIIAGTPGAEVRSTDPSIINNLANIFGLGGTTNFTSGRTFTFSPITTSLETEEVAVSDLRAFPTVMSDYLNVKGNVTRSGNLQLVLTDATGRTHQVRQVNGASGQLDERLAVSDLAPGFYVLDVRSGASSQRIKLVKQ